MRLTVLWVRPQRWAMDRVFQWVASRGVISSVNVITRSTSSSVTPRGRPRRGSSDRPSSLRSGNRERHFPPFRRTCPGGQPLRCCCGLRHITISSWTAAPRLAPSSGDEPTAPAFHARSHTKSAAALVVRLHRHPIRGQLPRPVGMQPVLGDHRPRELAYVDPQRNRPAWAPWPGSASDGTLPPIPSQKPVTTSEVIRGRSQAGGIEPAPLEHREQPALGAGLGLRRGP